MISSLLESLQDLLAPIGRGDPNGAPNKMIFSADLSMAEVRRGVMMKLI